MRNLRNINRRGGMNLNTTSNPFCIYLQHLYDTYCLQHLWMCLQHLYNLATFLQHFVYCVYPMYYVLSNICVYASNVYMMWCLLPPTYMIPITSNVYMIWYLLPPTYTSNIYIYITLLFSSNICVLCIPHVLYFMCSHK